MATTRSPPPAAERCGKANDSGRTSGMNRIGSRRSPRESVVTSGLWVGAALKARALVRTMTERASRRLTW
eukprot:12122018-Alexandrium_andersonii.AAC.1